MRLAIALALLAACGKPAPDRKQQCKTAARDAVAALMATAHAHATDPALTAEERASIDARNKSLDAIAPRFEAILGNHCIDDRWPAKIIDCYRGAKAFEQLRACRDQLPANAQAKLQADEMNLVGGDNAPPPPGLAPEPPRAPMTNAERDAAVAEANALAAQLKDLGAKINDASQRLASATTDTDRAAAKTELDTLTKQADELRSKLATAQAKAR